MTEARPSPTELAPGATFAERYQIESVLGRGGMGAVYRARDVTLGEPIALKLLSVGGGPASLPEVTRFRQEVRLARRVTHPNVARVFDIGEHGESVYLTMELVEGETLRAVLNREGSLPRGEASRVALALCAGLRAAHAAGVVHRDLKPANVLIERGGRVVITDFGIAHNVAAAERLTVGVVGTPSYMAPEQVFSGVIDARTDIYALGLVLHEMLTGRRPEGAAHTGLDPSLADLIERCTAPLPDARFASVDDVARVLAPMAAVDEPPGSRGVRGPERDAHTRRTPPDERAAAGRSLSQGPAGTRFFGRSAELGAIASAYVSGARLVTLVGPGGAGKTRCAQEVMSGGPSVLCDLSSATTPSMVMASVASALDVPLDGAAPEEWARGLGRALGASPDRLVVLDNAEQAIEVIAELVSGWIQEGARLMVTSREPLRVRGEHVVSLEQLGPREAMLLFADRASTWGADPGTDDIQSQIVERVDRLPLAIELAAAQVRELGAAGLLDSLDAQLATLVAGARDAPSRHATLRAAVEWSWTLLAPREREVLGQLSVFEGSFTLEGARAVVDGTNTVAVLASVRRRCQIRKSPQGERFALYAAVRELARERVEDRSAAEVRHASWFARAGTAAAALLDGPRHGEGAEVLSAELPELRAAWTRALDRDASLAARLALVLDRALGLRADKGAVRREILARSRERLEDPVLLRELLLAEGRTEGAPLDLLEQACALATTPRVEAEIRLARGERLVATGLAAARVELERALELAEASADALRGRALAGLGEVAWSHGLVGEASNRLRLALAMHVRTGDRRAIARTSALLAHVDRLEKGGGAARDLLRQAQAAAEELGEPVARARVLMDLGQHLTRVGDQTGARAALAEAASLYERVGFARDRAFLHLHVAETQVGVGDFEQALREALAALAALPDAGDVGRSTIYEAIGCIHLLRSELGDAERWIEDGLALARSGSAARSECTLLGKRGLLCLVRGSVQRAWEDFDDAVQKNEARGAMSMVGASLADRAMGWFALGEQEPAQQDLVRARHLLHDPPPETVDGRMLAMCEIVGRGFGSVRAGTPAGEAMAQARASASTFFDRVPQQEWDLVLRLGAWLVERIAG